MSENSHHCCWFLPPRRLESLTPHWSPTTFLISISLNFLEHVKHRSPPFLYRWPWKILPPAFSSIGSPSTAMRFQNRQRQGRAMRDKKAVPRLVMTDSGRVDRLESFPHYVGK